jgi:hypothetical protein
VTLVEFLAPLRDASQRDKVVATLYFLEHHRDQPDASVAEIIGALRQARIAGVAKWNVPRALSAAGENVDRAGTHPARWYLTDSGQRYCVETLGLSAPRSTIAHDVSVLTAVAKDISDDDVRAYVEEAITCLEAGALRAAIVFLWTGAIRQLHEQAIASGLEDLNDALVKHDPKSREVKTVDDFAYIKDSTFLDAARALGMLDKGEKDTMVESLNLRNRCGHPTRYRPRESKTKGFIEDVVGIVFA